MTQLCLTDRAVARSGDLAAALPREPLFSSSQQAKLNWTELHSCKIELGRSAKRTTPIVSSLDLDLYSFLLEPSTGPAVEGGRTMYHHPLCVK